MFAMKDTAINKENPRVLLGYCQHGFDQGAEKAPARFRP